MPDDRLPKAVFYSELTSGKRKRGGQKLRYRDVLKRHLKAADMEVDTWESDAKNRPFWRKKIIDAGNTIERKRKEKYLEGWRKRHPVIQLKTAFIEIDGQPMMMMMMTVHTGPNFCNYRPFRDRSLFLPEGGR